VQVQADKVVVTAIKRAKDDGALILRFFEWPGKEGDVDIQRLP
jgi:alpha-mannosidase